MKNVIIRATPIFLVTLFAFLLTSCADVLMRPSLAKTGVRITISEVGINKSARTVRPFESLAKYKLTFDSLEGDSFDPIDNVEPGTPVTVDLPNGHWIITADGYAEGGQLVVSGSGEFDISENVEINISVSYIMNENEQGTLKLETNQTAPVTVSYWLYSEKDDPDKANSITYTDSQDSHPLSPGYYWMVASVPDEVLDMDVVHIYSNMETVWNIRGSDDPYSITITGIPESGFDDVYIILYEDGSNTNDGLPIAGGQVDPDGVGTDNNDIMFVLDEYYGDEGTTFKSGDYVITLSFEDETGAVSYVYTRGKTYEELEIESRDDLGELPKYYVTNGTSIDFDKFKPLNFAEVETWGGLIEAVANNLYERIIITAEDLIADKTAMIGRDVTIFAGNNPVTIRRQGFGGAFFSFHEEGGYLTLGKPGDLDNKLILDGDAESTTVDSSLVIVNNGGTFFMNDGVTLQNNAATYVPVSDICNGGGVTVNDGTFTMNGGNITSNEAINGGGVYVYGGTFEMSGSSRITGNGAESGGGVYVENGTFEMSGSSRITGNGADDGGGGVYVKDGTFNMDDGNVNDNTTFGDGGGVFITDDAEFIMSGGAISRNGRAETGTNKSLNGGGVFVYDGTFKMSGGSITENEARQYGGGVSVFSSPTTTIISTIFEMTGGTISDNSAGAAGGGTYVGEKTEFTMSSDSSANPITITKNRVTADDSPSYGGGGVYVDNNAAFMMGNNSFITENEVSGNCYGGGVYVNKGTFDMSGNSVVKRNEAANGGGVYVIGREFTDGSKSFTMSDSASITENTAANNGGGVYLEDYIIVANGPPGVTMNEGTISRNKAGGFGGGVFVGTGWDFTFNGTMIMEDNELSDIATVTEVGDWNGLSSAIDNGDSRDNIEWENYIIITGSFGVSETVQIAGKHITILAEKNKDVTITRGLTHTEEFFKVAEDGHLTLGRKGYSTLTLDGDKGTARVSAVESSLVTVYGEGAAFTMNDGVTLKNNAATAAQVSVGEILNGGGVTVNGGTFTMNGGFIIGNEALRAGGGVELNVTSENSKTEFIMNGEAAITGNTTNSNGGGVNLAGGNVGQITFTMNGGTISGNKARDPSGTSGYGLGGGVFVGAGREFNYDSDVSLELAISDNESDDNNSQVTNVNQP